MPRKLVVYRDGFRYWATKHRDSRGQIVFKFWSNHEWPFYHGSYTPDKFDKKDVLIKFFKWIPTLPGGCDEAS